MSRSNVIFSTFVSILLFISVAACSRAPKGVIPEKKMRQILIDMYLADAIISADPTTFNNDENKSALYQSVFEKHHITEAIYDSSLIWYGKNLDIYMQVNNMALADVKKKIEEMGPVGPDNNKTVNEDSVDIWSTDRYYEFYPAALSNTIIFNIKGTDDYSSGSIFVLGLNVFGLAQGLKSPVDVQLSAQQIDTLVMVHKKIFKDGYYELILRTSPVQRVKQVYGYVRLNEDSVPYNKIYLDDFKMIKYRYGTEAAGRLDSLGTVTE
ncbi:MAG: DUF4296 domain-containing protein [Tannerella sp.]|jgi:hypothetical protein|nr:DUF4296 domain-containing protein [Tannerella sp.]